MTVFASRREWDRLSDFSSYIQHTYPPIPWWDSPPHTHTDSWADLSTPAARSPSCRYVQTLVPALSRMHPQTVVSRHQRSAVTSVLASNRLKRDPHVRLSVRRESSLRRQPVILQQTHHQQVQAFLFVPRVSHCRRLLDGLIASDRLSRSVVAVEGFGHLL